MPKMKTHKGTQKRVKITGTGKIMLRKAVPKRMRKHSRTLNQLRGDMPAHSTVTKAIRKNLPYA
ncbi:MAG: 50S ribosomal protein L35 [Dehalococcoidia bacterium]|nr:50S ribosomal protein L35 [Dehalococcoidia bacterium]